MVCVMVCLCPYSTLAISHKHSQSDTDGTEYVGFDTLTEVGKFISALME